MSAQPTALTGQVAASPQSEGLPLQDVVGFRMPIQHWVNDTATWFLCQSSCPVKRVQELDGVLRVINVTSAPCYLRVMFDAFSIRARQIVFAARFKAGERGATSIDVEHFLLGLVLEDQGMLVENLFSALQGQVGTPVNEIPSHVPFFSHEAAKNLLTRIEASFIAAKPVGLMTEIPLSPALERTFAAAKKIQVRFRSAHIEPLHLLAAILADAPSRCAKLLQQNGITKEQVLGQLRGTAES